MLVFFLFYLVVLLIQFPTSKCFDLFELTLLFKFFSLSSKSVFFAKSVISPLVAKFAYFDLAVKFYAVNLLNSGVVIHLLRSGISFSTAIRAELVAKLVNIGYFVFNLIYFSIKSSNCG